MNLKGLYFADVAEIKEALTDELKKVQSEEFSAAFQKLYDGAKACIYANGAYFELKKRYMSSKCVFDFKKISPKTFVYTGCFFFIFRWDLCCIQESIEYM